MNLTSTTICPECGAILDAPDGAEGVTCTDCGRVLRLRRGPTRTDAVVITGWEGSDVRRAEGRGPLPADDRAQALAELEAAWAGERERLSQPGTFILGRMMTRRAPSVWNAALWVLVGIVAVALQVVSVGRGSMAPSWWISGAATVAVCVLMAYVESVAAADIARARKRYEALRTAIVVGQAVDVRDLAAARPATRTRWSRPAVALVIVLLLTVAATVTVLRWAGVLW